MRIKPSSTTSRLEDSRGNIGIYSLARHAFIAVSLAALLAACISTQQRLENRVFDARRRNAAMPLPHVIDETLTIESAYRIQTRIVRRELNGAQPAGYKAGLTSPASQARFRASAPVAGVLMHEGRRHSGAKLRSSELRGLNIETEVALRIGTPIHTRLSSIDELRRHIDGVAPAIELPNLDYETPEALNALDIVATNVAAAAYIFGEFVAPDRRDPNDVSPRLVCNGKEVSAGNARDALSDQWQAALWLVNTVIDQGWRIEAGQVLMTGALGRMVPAQPGECMATYGEWGTIELTISP